MHTRQIFTGSEEKNSQLPVGANVFNFSTRLPNDLPSSFEGQVIYY